MATAISFDSTSIQTTNIHISEISHESIDHKEIQFERLGARDGAKFVGSTFAPRVIKLSGIIIGSTQADLESRIDDLKLLLNKKEKNLDIAYAGGTRRYKASCRKSIFERDYYNITFVPWKAEFVVSDPPFGTNTDTSTIEYNPINFTIGTWYTSGTFLGTYRPMPIIQITVNSETDLVQMNFTNLDTNEQIKVPYAYTAGDVLKVNTADYTVTVNGAAVDYEGVIPEFVQGGNDFKVSFSSTNHNVTMKIIYYPLWL